MNNPKSVFSATAVQYKTFGGIRMGDIKVAAVTAVTVSWDENFIQFAWKDTTGEAVQETRGFRVGPATLRKTVGTMVKLKDSGYSLAGLSFSVGSINGCWLQLEPVPGEPGVVCATYWGHAGKDHYRPVYALHLKLADLDKALDHLGLY